MNIPILPAAVTMIGSATAVWLGLTFANPTAIDPAFLPTGRPALVNPPVVVDQEHPDSHRLGRTVSLSASALELPDEDDLEAYPVRTLILDLGETGREPILAAGETRRR